MRRRWWVRIALTEDASDWSSRFGPYRTERAALRHGREIGSHRYPVLAEKVVPPTQRELLEQILATLVEIRDHNQRALSRRRSS